MKRINLFAGVLFVLLGFCAGVGFSLFSKNVEAQGRPEPPPAALKSVEHDATLTGDGTSLAPLGLANGAVTAPKLSAAAVPSVGQVLGFNGANLAWQDAPSSGGGVRVVDSVGQVVGPLFTWSEVLRRIGSSLFSLRVDSTGFSRNGTFIFYHTTSDCSDMRYFPAEGAGILFWRGSYSFQDDLFYAADPIQQITVRSFEQIGFPDDPKQPGQCHLVTSPTTTSAGLVSILDLATLGLVPPFHLEF